MSITAICPSCGRKKPMPDHFRWRRMRCPKCRAEFILKPDTMPLGVKEDLDTVDDPRPVGGGLAYSRAMPRVNALRVIGTIFLCGGLAIALWLLTHLDTVRETAGVQSAGQRVHNTGLMHQPENGIMLCVAVAALGGALLLVDQLMNSRPLGGRRERPA
jgi:hypothetical protein